MFTFDICYSTTFQFSAKCGDWSITTDPFAASIDEAKEKAINFMREFDTDFLVAIDAHTGEVIFEVTRHF